MENTVKNAVRKVRLFSICLLLLAGGTSAMQAQSYAHLWKQVEQAQKKGLPRTVIGVTGQIVEKAGREQNAPQLLKAVICRNAYREMLTPDSLYTHFGQLEQWVETEGNALNRAILHSVLAEKYAGYVQSNRRTLLQRTVTDTDSVPDDLREWSIVQFFGQIDLHSRAALQDRELLMQASTDAYVPFVEQEEGSRFYGHDLYHLLSGRAIEAYEACRGYTGDSLCTARILSLCRARMEAYRNRPGREDAVVLATVDFIRRTAGNSLREDDGGTGLPPYAAALDSLVAGYGGRETCAEAYLLKAQLLYGTPGKRYVAEALAACDEGIKRYPSYRHAGRLKELRDRMLRPELSIRLPQASYPGDTLDLNVSYALLDGFTLNLYATPFDALPPSGQEIGKDTYRKHTRKLSSVHYGLIPLPDGSKRAEDLPYLPSDTVLRLPMPDRTGVYVLQAVPDNGKAYRLSDKYVCTTRFRVSTLALGDGSHEFAVVDAQSGLPVEGAGIHFFSGSKPGKGRETTARLTTDVRGKAILPAGQKGIACYTVVKGEDTAMPPQYFHAGNAPSGTTGGNAPRLRLALLTDRPLYRPGQTVYVKGIAYRQEGDEARVLEGTGYELALLDANRRELATREVRTNEFGSFSAEFVLPSACLNGSFCIQTKDGKASSHFRVEEYKRPTFEIEFIPVGEAYRLGDTVRLEGRVKAYNGRSLQNVPLACTVTRRDPLPAHWNSGGQPLAGDTVMTDADGRFALPVRLEVPDGAGRAFYNYQVEVSLTDDAGETQTATYTLTAGVKAYGFTFGIPAQVCKEDSLAFCIGVHNADNQPMDIEGTYRLLPADGGQPVLQGSFTANRRMDAGEWQRLPSGRYRLAASVRDNAGREGTGTEETSFLLFSKEDKRPAAFTSLFYYAECEEFDTGHPATFLFGTSHRDTYVMMDVFANHRRVESRTWMLTDSIVRMEYPYKEEYGDGLSFSFRFVKDKEAHARQARFVKRQPDRTLRLRWEVFRDRLRPGQTEEWKLVVQTPQGRPAAAELLALMYDASLDQIYRRNQQLHVTFPRSLSAISTQWDYPGNISVAPHFPIPARTGQPGLRFDHFHACGAVVERNLYKTSPAIRESGNVLRADFAGSKAVSRAMAEEAATATDLQPSEALPASDAVRTDFAETAFFYPRLRTNGQGEMAISFTVPQSVTRWNFRGYAHTQDMMTGQLDASAVTAKELMLTPNLPRFVRAGDKAEVAASIANLSGATVKGTARLILFDPATEQVISSRKQKFTAEAGRTATVRFRFEADARHSLLGIRLVAESERFSDGEQHLLPVLADKTCLTEALPLVVRGRETRTFALDSLFNRNSRTATGRRLTVEFTGNPAWYAVQALPVLGDPVTDNATAWGTAFYANALAGYIADSHPRIKAVLDQWKAQGTSKETLLGRLEQNRDVKSILLEESPWVMEARDESERMARIATLFDPNQLDYRTQSALAKLQALQAGDGSWSWYKGMDGNRLVTGYITTLLVRLPLLTGQDLPAQAIRMRQKAFTFLHKEALQEYTGLRKAERQGSATGRLSSNALDYLYLTALSGEPIPEANKAAYGYFFGKLKHELPGTDMGRKAKAAVVLLKAGHRTEAGDFLASIEEHLIREEETGAHFAFADTPNGWGGMPVPTHVAAMEALAEGGGRETLTEEMKLWLLKQKQTNAWDNPVATADAVYALLCRGTDLSATQGAARITLGETVLETRPQDTDALAGLGYLKQTYTEGCSELEAGTVTVEKADDGIAWGAVYAQYLSPLADVREQGGALGIGKRLYVKRVAPDGQESLQSLDEAGHPSVGDEVVVRIILRLDRAMDFLQLKDQRAACFEPTGSLSGYRQSDGTGYYMEVEDAATNFFFDHLDKGTYVLECSYRIDRRGTYRTGVATLQCAYAPEFSAHTAGGSIRIK